MELKEEHAQQTHLQDVGFTEGEERVYIALLRLGPSSTGPIAKEAGVSRSKLYEILEKLARKGVVSHYQRNNVKTFAAARPERILDYIDHKEKELQQQKTLFSHSLPYFEGIIGKNESTRDAQVFEGMEGIKTVRETALEYMKSGEIMYYFGNSKSSHEHVLGYWDDWNNRRVKKKLWAYIIYNQDAKEFGERRKKWKYTKVKYLPKAASSPAWIEIYGDVTALALKEETPMSVVFNNKLVAQSFKTYFNILWDVSLSRI
jgi:sugar-specific transcriptional regulator TrmB